MVDAAGASGTWAARPKADSGRGTVGATAAGVVRSAPAAWFAWLPRLLALVLVLALGAACAREDPRPVRPSAAPMAEVPIEALPPEARQTLQLIQRGGPFPYRKDGTVFFNRERLLPPQPRGYYTEYTVPTAGNRDRGARRIVAGRGSTGDPATSGEYYYTDDHYRSFSRIRP